MFDDPRKELKRLQRELLAEEEDDELADIKALLEDDVDEEEETDYEEFFEADYEEEYEQEPFYRNHANGYGRDVRNYANNYGRSMSQALLEEEDDYGYEEDDEEEDVALYMDDLRESRKRPKEKGIRGLVILAWMEFLAILAIIGWWIVWLWK